MTDPAPRGRSPVRVRVEDSIEPFDVDAWVRRYVGQVLRLEGLSTRTETVAEPARRAVP